MGSLNYSKLNLVLFGRSRRIMHMLSAYSGQKTRSVSISLMGTKDSPYRQAVRSHIRYGGVCSILARGGPACMVQGGYVTPVLYLFRPYCRAGAMH